METWVLSLLVKATLTLSAALLAVRFARHSRAAVRHLWLTTAFVALLVLPLAAMLVPAVQVEVMQAPPALAKYLAEPIAIDALPAVSVPSSQTVTLPAVPRWTPTEIVAIVWLAGLVVFALPVAAGAAQVRRFRRKAIPWLDGQRLVGALATEAGLRRPVDVALHESIDAPATCGIRRHAILFPVDARTWPDEDVARAAVHELEHVRRADCLVNAFARVMCAVYWFHPLAWIAWRRLSVEAERACDDAVLGRADATTYADQLVTLAGRHAANAHPPLLAMANRNDLVQRVAALLDQRHARGPVGVRLSAVIVVTALTAAMAISSLQAVSRPPRVALATNPLVTSAGIRPPSLLPRSVERPTETDIAQENVDVQQVRSAMRNMPIPARSLAALMIGVASLSAGHAQSGDVFRIGTANRPANRLPADPGLERQLEEAFTSGRAWTDLSLAAEVTFRQLNSAEYAVPVSVRIAPAAELAVGRRERSRLDFIASVTDDFGTTIANMRDAAELTLDPASIPALAKTPIIYDGAAFTLLPGRYMLKVLARDQTTGRMGSTSVGFTIPNLNRQQPR